MPIPTLKVKSPQSWKKKKIKPLNIGASSRREKMTAPLRAKPSGLSDRLIKERKERALKKKILRRAKPNKKESRFSVPHKLHYYGARKPGGGEKLRKWSKRLLKLGIIGVIVLILMGTGIFFYYSSQVPTREEFLATTEGSSTKIYDRTGEKVLYNLSGDQRKTFVPLDQIPEHVKWALIAIEDDQFYTHPGFDIPALIKVGLHEVFGIGSPRGGSTITQQLVKNTLLSPEHTYRRKIREMIISYHLEKKLSKDEILELYFNVVPYGSTAYGIESAAEIYFGKKASELDLAEGAVLAAMLKATTYYSPYGNHVDELLARQRLVLKQMERLGYISKAEMVAAANEKLEFKRLRQNILAPHFVLYIKELLAEKYGEEMVNKGGLKVITTLDWEKQKIAEEAIAAGVERNEKKYGAHNAALVSINARTGEVLAMVGSRDYFNEKYDGAVNVTMRPRQPGSSFKPIVYAASFMKGLSPETILFDVLTTFKTETGEDYEPHNYDDEERGPVSIRKALQGSLNIPAVKTIYLTGVSNVLDLAESLGYTTFGDRSRFGLSLVLGGGEVKLIDHVRAFAVFAQNGKRVNLQYILRVEDSKGKVLEEFDPSENKGEEVMDPQVAKMMNNILSDDEARSYVFGLGSKLTLPGRPVAAKTGTTNDYRDGWTIGYTPSLVAGVWVGNNDNSAMKGKAAGGNVAAPIWNEYMKRALAGTPVEQFAAPKPIELPQKPMLNGKVAQEIVLRVDRASGKLATPNTPPSFIEEKTFQELHSILHYVNVNNILGPVPEHPEKDSQYKFWEEGVVNWAKENNVEIADKIPTEKDDLHTEANKPQLEIVEPGNNQLFVVPDLNVKVTVHTARTIGRVEYYIDGQLIDTETRWPFNLNNYQMLGFKNGDHWLRAIAYDDIDNSREKSVRIRLNLPSEYSKPVIWLEPTNKQQLYQAQFPYNLRVRVNNHTLYEKIDFYIRKEGASSVWVGYNEPVTDESTVMITEAAPGNYDFYVILTGQNGKVVQDEGVRVEVLE